MRILMILLQVLFLLVTPLAHAESAPSVIGEWKTIDDTTGKAKSIVEIYEASDGRLAGRVSEIIDTRNGRNPICEACKGANHHKPIKGMVILWNLQMVGAGKWANGRVLDPENGKDYKAKLEVRSGGRKLAMSGCIAFICREQTWIRN